MDIVSIIARVASGWAVKLIAAALACYLVAKAWGYVSAVFGGIHGIMG
jgi:hypothetical protein